MPVKVVVPAYNYPSGGVFSPWRPELTNAIFIANISSGPGSSPVLDDNYKRAIAEAQANGVKVVGYVSTAWATRPLEIVQAEIDMWFALVPSLQGIFTDEMAAEFSKLSYYTELAKYMRAGRSGARIFITNPGCAVDASFQSMKIPGGVTWIMCTFEGDVNAYAKHQAAPWEKVRPRPNAQLFTYHIIYGAFVTSVPSLVQRAKAFGVSYVYVTDDVIDSPQGPFDQMNKTLLKRLILSSQA